MHITKKEKVIIKWIVEKALDGKKEFTLDEMLVKVHRTIPKPTNARSSMASTLRNLAAKVSGKGLRLYRSSNIGRSQKAVYLFAGNFANLIKKETL